MNGRKRGWGMAAIGIILMTTVLMVANLPGGSPESLATALQKDNTMDTTEQILEFLDYLSESDGQLLPMFDAEEHHPAAFRLSVYRSDEIWVIAIEEVTFSEEAGCVDRLLYFFGNQTERDGLHMGDDYQVSPVLFNFFWYGHPEPLQPYLLRKSNEGEWDYDWIANYEEFSVIWQGETLTFRLKREDYERIGIQLKAAAPGEGSLEPEELTRMVVHHIGDDIFTPDASLLKFVIEAHPEEMRDEASQLKLFYRTKRWEHPDLGNGQVASETHFFPLLAEAISSGDVGLMDRFDVRHANTTWQFWAAKQREFWESLGDGSGTVEVDPSQPEGMFKKILRDPPERN